MSSPRHRDDRALAQRALTGDEAAGDALADRLRCVPRFLAVRNHRAGHPLRVEDLAEATQEAVTSIWQGLANYRGDAAFETWVYAVCGGVFAAAVKRAATAPTVLSAIEGGGVGNTTSTPEPFEFEHVHACIEALPAADRQVVIRRTFDDQRFEAIAEQTGLGVEALRTRYYRALRKLGDCLAPFLRSER